jgi:hypothetical protein
MIQSIAVNSEHTNYYSNIVFVQSKMYAYYIRLLGGTAIYSEAFSIDEDIIRQCDVWKTFRSSLTDRSYSTLTMSGSRDPTGITLTNPAYVTAIAQALRTGVNYGPVSSDNFSWRISLIDSYVSGGGGFDMELTSTGSIPDCVQGYTVRPCIQGAWGGINGDTCSAPNQTITITFTWA